MSDTEDGAILLLVNQGELAVANDTSQSPIPPKPSPNTQKSSTLLVMSATTAALGGLLFGYDVGIISTALPQIQAHFGLDCFQQEMVVSFMLIGALVASLAGGPLVDKMGSRWSIVANAGVFIGGALVLSSSGDYATLLAGRFCIGWAVALSAVSECIYITEVSAAHNRGMLVSLNELGITVGFLAAFLAGLAYADRPDGWRFMFGLSVAPAVIQLVGMIILPNSPQYLASRHREREAEEILRRLHGFQDEQEVRQELTNIRLELEDGGSAPGCASLCSPVDNMRSCLLIAAGLVMAQQLTGQPNVLYYAPTIFQQIGFCGTHAATLATVSLGVIKVLATVASLLTIDRLGRRRVLLLGAGVMAVSLVLLATFALIQQQQSTDTAASTCREPSAAPLNATDAAATQSVALAACGSSLSWAWRLTALAALMCYVAAYSFGFGPVTWLVLSEIFPSSVKGRAMAVATSLNWASNLLLSATFLSTMQSLTLAGVLAVYAMVTLLGGLFVFGAVPETRGRSLRQIGHYLSRTTFAGRFADHCRTVPWLSRRRPAAARSQRYTSLPDGQHSETVLS